MERERRGPTPSSAGRECRNNDASWGYQSGSGRVRSPMPETSRFLGIVVRMYYRDHDPPHFHAHYGDYSIVVSLDSWVVEGRFPPRALKHVLEWAELHPTQLAEDWDLARARRPLKPIPPLE